MLLYSLLVFIVYGPICPNRFDRVNVHEFNPLTTGAAYIRVFIF